MHCACTLDAFTVSGDGFAGFSCVLSVFGPGSDWFLMRSLCFCRFLGVNGTRAHDREPRQGRIGAVPGLGKMRSEVFFR